MYIQLFILYLQPMTREVIINTLANNEQLKAYARKTTKGNTLWEDIISEMLLYLMELPEERFIQIYRSEGLQSYCYKIIHLSWNSENSPFYKKYKRESSDLTTDRIFEQANPGIYFQTKNSYSFEMEHRDKSEPYNHEIDITYKKCVKAVKMLKYDVSKSGMPTKAILFDLYLQHGSYRKVAKQLSIPTMTIFKIINNIKDEIKATL